MLCDYNTAGLRKGEEKFAKKLIMVKMRQPFRRMVICELANCRCLERRTGVRPHAADSLETIMARLQVFDPFVTNPFDEVVRGFFRPTMFEQQEMAPPPIKIDVEEQDKSYTIRAEIPGVKKEDIGVNIDGNLVTITAEVKREKDVKENGGKVLRCERYFGTMTRSFTLGVDIDESMSDAKYVNGMLELTLPKKASAVTRRLTVH
jgi:HSP20 family protein